MLQRITNLFTQSIPRDRNSSIVRTPRYTSEQENSYESTVSVSSLSDKKIQNSRELNSELYRAIKNNLGINKIKELLDNGADPNAWIKEKYTYPMKCAIDCGNLEAVKLLLAYKAKIDGHYKYLNFGEPFTNLTIAVIRNKYDVVKLLLEEGANPNFKVWSYYYTALSQAAISNHIEIAKLLIEYGAKIDGFHYDATPLSVCDMNKNVDNSVMKLLLEKGADPSYGYSYSQPFFNAIRCDNAEALLLLFSYDTKDTFKNMIGEMMLNIVRHNSIKCMQVLLEYGFDINGYYLNDDDIRMTPLMMALSNWSQYSESKINFIIYLLDNGANIGYRKEKRYKQLFRYILSNNAKPLSLLLSCCTKDQFKNIIGKVMLQIIECNSIKGMQVLLDNGYNINGYYLNYENIRMTPLEMAIGNREQYSESTINFIIYLLDNGANIVYRKEQRYQPCFRAIQANNSEILLLLLRRSAEDKVKNIIDQMMLLVVKHNSVKCMQVLLDYGCDINGYYINYENMLITPMMMALSNLEQYSESKMKFIIYLLDNGANIVSRKELDYQQCFRSIRDDNAEMLSFLLRIGTTDGFKNIVDKMMFQIVKYNSVKCMQVLLDYGCDINEYYINDESIGMTPLMKALDTEYYTECRVCFIKYLLEKGAGTNVKYEDGKGTTLIEKVIENNHLYIAFQLRRYGAQADETIVNKIINRYGFDPNVVKSLMVLAATVVKTSFKYSFDHLAIPTSLKLELEEK